MVLSEAVCRARWVEAEVLHLKRMGLSFAAIAEQITRVGRGRAQAMTPIPDGVSFPPDYQISRQACYKACCKALAREPALGVAESRKIDQARTEDMFMNLQPAIRKGNLKAVQVGISVLDHAAKINGYAAPQPRNETTPLGDSDDRISIAAARRIIDGYNAIEVTSPPQRLLTGSDNGPSPSASAAGGVASPNNNNLVSDDDVVALHRVIEWSEIEKVRDLLAEADEMKAFLPFI